MLKTLTRAESAGILFLILLVLIYAVGSLVLHFYMDSIYALQFAGITVVGALAFFLGWQVKIRARMPLLQLDVDQFILLLWVPFLIFAVVAWSTAEQIPLVAALGAQIPKPSPSCGSSSSRPGPAGRPPSSTSTPSSPGP